MAVVKGNRSRREGWLRSLVLPVLCVFILLFGWERSGYSPDSSFQLSAFADDGSTSSGKFAHDSSQHPIIQRTFAGFTNEQLKPFLGMFSMVGPLHLNLALEAAQKINEQGIEGAVVECGVWKGGVSMGMMMVNQRYNTDRHFWLYDTFEGLPEPADDKNGPHAQQLFREVQNKIHKNITTKAMELFEKRKDLEDGKWNYGPLEVVKNNMYFSGYPRDKLHFIQGKVEDTLVQPHLLPDKIAILRLDTDWYESTKIELEVLYERLQPGGLLAIDDFCHWPGSTRATEEYFRDKLGIDAQEIRNRQVPCFHYWKPK